MASMTRRSRDIPGLISNISRSVLDQSCQKFLEWAAPARHSRRREDTSLQGTGRGVRLLGLYAWADAPGNLGFKYSRARRSANSGFFLGGGDKCWHARRAHQPLNGKFHRCDRVRVGNSSEGDDMASITRRSRDIPGSYAHSKHKSERQIDRVLGGPAGPAFRRWP